LATSHDLCLPGAVVSLLAARSDVSSRQLHALLDSAVVFARTSPVEKERIVCALRASGRVALMCGDGTNDVGALKQAQVGVALLTAAGPGDAERKRRDKEKEQRDREKEQRERERAQAGRPLTQQEQAQRQWAEAMRQLEEDDSQPQLVKLGDASVAAPFASRSASVTSTLNIIRQGRCTLVTTMQMVRISHC
jgi:cation-transporting ATPase 13A1